MSSFAFELQHFGSGGLQRVRRAVPEPAAGEVLLRLRAAALNHHDLEIAQGHYGMTVPLPIVPLSDAVGEVVALGAGVQGLAVGERVNPVFFPDWADGPFRNAYFARQLGGNVDGVLREYMTAPAGAVMRAPAHLGDEAAALPIAALTAWAALSQARLLPGHTVLVIGTGGVSLFALQFAALFGARAVVAASDDEKLARALRLGAAAGVNHRREPQWGHAVRELAGGEGVDLVVEVGGAQTWSQSTAALRTRGTIAVVGYASGPRLDFDLRELFIGKCARLQGHTVGSRAQFDAMNRALEASGIVPVIDSRHSIEELDAAYARLRDGAFGKVLISL